MIMKSIAALACLTLAYTLPAFADSVHLEGDVRITGPGSGLVFPDGSMQYTATLQGPQGPQGPEGPAGTLTGVTAGGSLAGTYPNPSIASGAVGESQLAVTPAVRLSMASSPAIGNSVAATVAWGQLDYEQGGDLYKVTPTASPDCQTTPDACRLYAPVAGIYEISAGVAWDFTSNVAGSRWMGIILNDGRSIGATQVPAVTDYYTWMQQVVSTQMKLNAGDFVSVRIYQYYLSENTTQLVAGQDRTFFAMRWAGKVP